VSGLDADQAFKAVDGVGDLRMKMPGMRVAGLERVLHNPHVRGPENHCRIRPFIIAHRTGTSGISKREFLEIQSILSYAIPRRAQPRTASSHRRCVDVHHCAVLAGTGKRPPPARIGAEQDAGAAVDLPCPPGNLPSMTILSGKARVAGIIGWPVSHSRSPRLHGFWLDRHAIDGAYIPLAIPPEVFPETVRGLMNAGFAGANVTIPHKRAAFAICDHVEETARRAGAVNTLVFHEGRITGSNTDGGGFLANLRAYGVN